MRKMLMVLVASIATLALASAASAATSPITYSGQGVDANGKPTTQICKPGDAGGTAGDVTGNYLLWNLAASKQANGPVTLHLPDGDVQMELNGTWKYVSKVYPLADLLTVTVDFTGTEPTNLVISHGCTGAKLDGKIATTILDEGGTAVPGTPPAAALGSKVKDSVTFTPAAAGSSSDMTAGATVTYHFYTGACGDNSAEVGTGDTVPAGTNSPLTAALAAGSYHYTASYSGNDAYNAIAGSDCEPLTINKAQLKITTQIHGVNGAHSAVGGATHVPLGSTVHDTATVTGAVDGFAIGAVSFTRDGSPVDNDLTADGTATARSMESGALAAGDYTYKASVAGNANYEGDLSADEPLTVDKAQLKITTQIHGVNGAHSDVGGATHVPLGSTVHDTATVTGAVDGFAIGAVSFTLDGSPVDNDPTADGTATARSMESGALAAGAYTYKASVVGNANYEGDLSADEPLTVDKKDTTVVTQVHDGAHTDITGKSVASGITVHDSSTVNGAIDAFPLTGSVTYRLYNNGTCSGDPVSTEGPLAVGTESSGLVTTNGAWGYKVTYGGNANYNESVGPCEPFSVLTFGKTMGFWGNQNGIAKIIAGGGYLANAVTIGRGATIDTQAEASKVLPNSLNACGKGTPSIFTVGAATATANCTLATGVNINSLNTLAAQTLALGYNIKLVAGYAGQTVAGLGSTAFLTAGLSGTSTVQDAFNAAVALINGSAAGGTTTQGQIGAMNALLGSLNREA